MSNSCAYLDDQGKRCRARKGLKSIQYHGDHELYYSLSDTFPRWPHWVEIKLCPKHKED